MPDNEMQIILNLVDNATKELKDSTNKIKGSLDEVQKNSVSLNKNIQEGFKESSKQARNFRRDLMLVVGVITGIVNATREYAKYNKEARESIDQIDASIQKMSINAGRALNVLMPLFKSAAEGWSMIFDVAVNVTSGKGFFLSPEDSEINNIITAGQELKNFSETQKQINDQFLAGKISSQEYYAQLKDSSFAQMEEMQKLQQFHQETLVLAEQGMRTLMVSMGKTIQTNLSGAIADIATGTKKAKEAFTDLGNAMIRTVVEFIAQKVIAFALEKTLLAGHVIAAEKAGAATAAAWGPAAVAANIASFGAAGAAAAASAITAGIATATAMGMAGAAGRSVEVSVQSPLGSSGPAFGGAQANGGDYLVTRPTLFLAGEAGPERATFSPVGGGGGGGGINIEINYPQMGGQSDVQGLAEMLGFEIERKLRGVRALA